MAQFRTNFINFFNFFNFINLILFYDSFNKELQKENNGNLSRTTTLQAEGWQRVGSFAD